ncbi:MAG: beta-galactosidase [Fimbriimonas sp.]
MAHLENRRYVVGGKPVLVLAGEVHYFRLKRSEWLDRITKAREGGCNAIASYIPWLFHEEQEGKIHLGQSPTPEHELAAFIDLCREQGLWFLARPGPFMMGEVKNEGIPDWIYTKCPDAVPTTWGGKKATSKNLNYLNPGFLRYVERWYQAVMPIIAERLDSKGGNIIAVQLDNEIGMLQCWTEEADLSEDTLCDFTEWVQKHHSSKELKQRYPFDFGDPASRAKHLWDGTFASARYFHADYTEFTRDRFARYAATLRKFAEASGVTDVPFVINLHGSGGGRATTFPIGISQCFRAYTQAPGFWASSDHYLGELTRSNAGDLYFLNAFMACMNRPEAPLSSIEFEAGTGDYGETGAVRQTGAATDFKARLSVVQGNRMLNHYLLAGGTNPYLAQAKQDGNSRVGTTGEHHGFAAPIGPTGRLDATYFALKDTNETLSAVGHLLANMDEEHDSISLGFVPDYYSTDVKRPGPIQQMVSQVERARGPLEGMVRAMLFSGLSFPAVNLQAEIPKSTRSIALASASCLHASVQRRLVEFVRSGGNLLLYGRMPIEDLEGRPCRILADALDVTLQPIRNGSSHYFPSTIAEGWAAAEPEVRMWEVQPFTARHGQRFLRLAQTEFSVASVIPLGKGKVVFASSELPFHPPLWRGLFDQLGVAPAVRHDWPDGGVLLNRIRDNQGQRFISLINLDSEAKTLNITESGQNLLGIAVNLPGRRAKLLPLGVTIGGLKIKHATAEITRVTSEGVIFRSGQTEESVVISGEVQTELPTRFANGESTVQIPPNVKASLIRR